MGQRPPRLRPPDQAYRHPQLRRPVPNPRHWPSKRMTIGQHGPLLTFDQANGRPGLPHRRCPRARPRRRASVQAASAYLAGPRVGLPRELCRPKKRPKSVRDDRAMFDDIVLPKLGSQK